MYYLARKLCVGGYHSATPQELDEQLQEWGLPPVPEGAEGADLSPQLIVECTDGNHFVLHRPGGAQPLFTSNVENAVVIDWHEGICVIGFEIGQWRYVLHCK